jgi:hypothetical protein
MSVSCALLATSLNQCSRRFIRLTQPARCSPEKRARMRAFFANGVDKMHIPWAVEGLPTLLHLSLFLFLGGLVIFLFNVDHAVFSSVMWWIGLFSIVYGLITVLPIFRHDSPYYAPLSRPAWFLYAGMNYVPFKVLHSKSPRGDDSADEFKWLHISRLKDRYHGWMLGGVEKAAEETVSKRSSEIDLRIFDWTIDVLGDDDSLEAFFEAIPGFFGSNLVKHQNFQSNFPEDILNKFWYALLAFRNRTLLSNSVIDSVKKRRLIICRDVMSVVSCPFPSEAFGFGSIDQTLVSIEKLQAMAQWRTHKNDTVADYAWLRVAKGLASLSMQERDGHWIKLATDVSGLVAQDLWNNVAHAGDNVLLATLIQVTRRAIPSHTLWFVKTLPKLDIHHTLPGLQHSFCSLWNELVQEASNELVQEASNELVLEAGNHFGGFDTTVKILHSIHHLYIALHYGADAAPTAFSGSANDSDSIPVHPFLRLYPPCNIASHRPDCTSHWHPHIANSHAASIPTGAGDSNDASPYQPPYSGSTILQHTEQVNISLLPPSPPCPTTTSEIGGTSHAPGTTPQTNPVHSSPRPTDTSAIGGVATIMLEDITPATTLSHPLEGTTQQDIVPQFSEQDILSTASTSSPTPTLVPLQASTPPVQNKSLASYDTGAASTSNPSLASSVVGFSIPAYPPSRIPPLPNAEILLLSSTTPSHPTGNVTVPRLRARGLNTGSMCPVKAVLQLLVHSPPFWDLFRELSDLKWQRGVGGPETGGGATPLMDATVRFFEEFEFKVKEPPPTQRAAGRKPREDEKVKKERNAVPTYVYDAMKENRQLKSLLVCFLCPERALLLLTCAGLLCKGRQVPGCGRVFRPLSGCA